MAAFVSLLRGVNVGKANRVPMAGLRSLLTGLGYSDVTTLLNSGNAVFRARRGSSARHAADIAAAMADQLGVEVPVIVKSDAELAAIIKENPFAEAAADPSRLLVAFTQEARDLRTLAPLVSLASPRDRFVIGKSAAYLHCAAGILQSKAGKALLGKAGRSATTRNWATTLKLQRLLAEREF